MDLTSLGFPIPDKEASPGSGLLPQLRAEILGVDAYLNPITGEAGLAILPQQYGALADGSSHALSSQYGTLTGVRTAYPNVAAAESAGTLAALSLLDQIDWISLQETIYVALGRNRTNGSGLWKSNRRITLRGHYVI